VTLAPLADWAVSTRACAVSLAKQNFLIASEVTGGDTSLYLGRGRTPSQRPVGFLATANLSSREDRYFLRKEGEAALDGVAFHYSVYRALHPKRLRFHRPFFSASASIADVLHISSPVDVVFYRGITMQRSE
jgi:hypothetical protein